MSADSDLMALLRAIAEGDGEGARALVRGSPDLARTCGAGRARRGNPRRPHFLEGVRHYVYAGDTALHVAAAAHDAGLATFLLDLGADPRARNRHGAEPLHYAADGAPGLPGWDPGAQAAAIACLIAAGADPNAADKRAVTPLHRAVRTRSAAAVGALLEGGADPDRRNRKRFDAAGACRLDDRPQRQRPGRGPGGAAGDRRPARAPWRGASSAPGRRRRRPGGTESRPQAVSQPAKENFHA